MGEAFERPHVDRASDKGFWCVVALRLSQFWDFIDKRDIDKHATAVAIITAYVTGTFYIMLWAMRFVERWLSAAELVDGAEQKAIAGSEVAMVLTAMLGPWSLLGSVVISAVISFYFKARS